MEGSQLASGYLRVGLMSNDYGLRIKVRQALKTLEVVEMGTYKEQMFAAIAYWKAQKAWDAVQQECHNRQITAQEDYDELAERREDIKATYDGIWDRLCELCGNATDARSVLADAQWVLEEARKYEEGR